MKGGTFFGEIPTVPGRCGEGNGESGRSRLVESIREKTQRGQHSHTLDGKSYGWEGASLYEEFSKWTRTSIPRSWLWSARHQGLANERITAVSKVLRITKRWEVY